MFRTLAAAFLVIGFTACNQVPVVRAQSVDIQVDDSQPVETTEAPPPLPEYDQPEAPGPDYYWTPGYWAFGPGGYYWVPGDWVLTPWVGALWTPPYWGFEGGHYLWHSGYWGSHVGFYGGINYGFGYPGRGYYGADWRNGHLFYNRSVMRINDRVIHNVYNSDVPRFQSSRTSFNGGGGGISMRPTPQEQTVMHERRTPAQSVQMRNAQQAQQQHNRTRFAAPAQPQRVNNARPAPAAPQPAPQEPRMRTEQRSAPQRREINPAPHPAPVAPQPQAQPQQRRRPDLQNHLELQQQRPAQAPAPHANPPQPQHSAPAPHANPPQPRPAPQQAAPARGDRGGEHGRGRDGH